MYVGNKKLLDLSLRQGKTDRGGKDGMVLSPERDERKPADQLRGVERPIVGAFGTGNIRTLKTRINGKVR